MRLNMFICVRLEAGILYNALKNIALGSIACDEKLCDFKRSDKNDRFLLHLNHGAVTIRFNYDFGVSWNRHTINIE